MSDVFIGSEAVLQGSLTPYQLRSRFRWIYPDVYLADYSLPSLRQRSEAAWLWSGRRGVVAGLAAAALHGSEWIDDDEPIELIWRNPHPPGGIITRNQRIAHDEVTRVAGLPVTTPARTAFDLGRLLRYNGAVARLDALMAIMATLDDTCLLHRGGISALQAAQRGARDTLTAGGSSSAAGRRALLRLDAELVERNASPGGCADLLGACIFLDSGRKQPPATALWAR